MYVAIVVAKELSRSNGDKTPLEDHATSPKVFRF